MEIWYTLSMKKELALQLQEKYPKLFEDLYGDPKKTCMSRGIECDDGWYFLVKEVSRQIMLHVDLQRDIGKPLPKHPKFAQIKEKLGRLRIYLDNGDDHIYEILQIFEVLSVHFCEVCGKHGDEVGQTTSRYLKVICDGCLQTPPWDCMKENNWMKNDELLA